jgi:hypothetical protein
MGSNFMQGIHNVGDIATGNWQDIGEYKLTPRTESLADKLFPARLICKAACRRTYRRYASKRMRDNTKLSDYSGALIGEIQ